MGYGDQECAYLLMDLCPTTLVHYLITPPSKPETHKLSIFRDLLRGVAVMHAHSPPITHRDIKAENILRDEQGRWCLSDFGSVSTAAGPLRDAAAAAAMDHEVLRLTTPAYRAPELWNCTTGTVVGPPTDIWALGILWYWMLADGRALPFPGTNKTAIQLGQMTAPPRGSPGAVRLVEIMLQQDPLARPDIHTLMRIVEELLANPGSVPHFAVAVSSASASPNVTSASVGSHGHGHSQTHTRLSTGERATGAESGIVSGRVAYHQAGGGHLGCTPRPPRHRHR